MHYPPGFAAEEITVHLEPESGLAPELSDVEIVACLSECIMNFNRFWHRNHVTTNLFPSFDYRPIEFNNICEITEHMND